MVEAIQGFMRVVEDCCHVASANGKVSGAIIGQFAVVATAS
jgi:hypothetical protein